MTRRAPDKLVTISVPRAALAPIREVLAHIEAGLGVIVVPVADELTTHEAARVLQVSRRQVIKLLDGGVIPSRRVGTHRRVRADDCLAFLQRPREARITPVARPKHRRSPGRPGTPAAN